MDDGIGRTMGWSALFVLLLLLAMFFSASELAIASCSKNRLRKLSEEGNLRAGALHAMRERQPDLVLWNGAGAVLCLLAGEAAGLAALVPWLTQLLSSWMEPPAGQRLGLLLAFVIVSFLSITLGYVFPKKLVTCRPKGASFPAVELLRVIGWVFRPLTFLCLKSARLLVRLLGFDPNQEAINVTEEEIRLMVDAGKENGAIELDEREMINNIFEFDDRTAGEIMTHRTDIAAVPADGALDQVLEIARTEGFSRIPIYEGGLDNIVGIVYAKDLLALVGSSAPEGTAISEYMRSVVYVPQSARCGMLLRQFKESKVHMAVVVDEYGGTAGIVTMEDLLESIVGSIQDEYDRETDEIERLGDNIWAIDGSVPVERVEELLGAELESEEDGETLGGLITNTLGRIPEDGEMPVLILNGIRFTVLAAADRRILRVQAQRLPAPAAE